MTEPATLGGLCLASYVGLLLLTGLIVDSEVTSCFRETGVAGGSIQQLRGLVLSL